MLDRLFYFIACLGVTILVTVPAQANGRVNDEIVGTWATQGYGAQVLISACDLAGDTLCGRLTWLWTDRDSQGHRLKDAENPDARFRTRPLVGITIFRDFTRSHDGRWQGAGIYNPQDGNTYSASLKPRPDGTLDVTGCVLGIFCQTQVWRRPQSICPKPAIIAGTSED